MNERNGFARGRRSAVVGAAVGMALAVCVYLWDVGASEWFGVPVESVSVITLLAGMGLGFPLGSLILTLADSWGMTGVNDHLLISLSIVVNWAALGYAWGYLRRRA